MASSSVFSLPTPLRFGQWYSTYADIFNETSSVVCADSLAAYMADYRNLQTRTCDAHLDCVLENTSESLKAKMASAAIFLGVLPAMLAMLGPTLGQLSLLSVRRPFLALLVAMGTSGFAAGGIFTVESPAQILDGVQGERLVPRIRGTRWGVIVSVAEYAAAALALFNVAYLCTRLGDRTIMSFKCTVYFLPLLWLFSVTFVYLLVAIPFQFTAVARHLRGTLAASDARSITSAGSQDAATDDTQWMPLRDRGARPTAYLSGAAEQLAAPSRKGTGMSARDLLLRELTTSVSRRPTMRADDMPEFETWMATLLNLASLTLAIHIILGTCWFSSILFLGPTDAIKIIMRFFGSALACRLIIVIELAGMKAHEMSSREEVSRPAPAVVPSSYQEQEPHLFPASRPYPGT